MTHYLYNNILFDINGYLKLFQDWNELLAIEIAQREKIILTEPHWQVIHFIRNFYIQYKIPPSMRILAKNISIKLNINEDSVYLFRLFPQGPSKQATKIAGLPKPIRCL